MTLWTVRLWPWPWPYRQLQQKRLRRWNLKPSIGGSTSTMWWNPFSEPSIFFGSSDWLVQGVTCKASVRNQVRISTDSTNGFQGGEQLVCAAFFVDPRKPDVKRFLVLLMTCRVLKLGVFRKSFKGHQKVPRNYHRFQCLRVVKQLKYNHESPGTLNNHF